MSFKTAVQNTPHLAQAWRPGLQALRAQDRGHISPQDPRLLKGSADIDSALAQTQPNANRWDFAIAYRHSNRKKDCVYWVEVHTASDAEIRVVLAKLTWLKQWLATTGNPLASFERDFVWVSSGATSFTLSAPQVKIFAPQGLQFKGRILRITTTRK